MTEQWDTIARQRGYRLERCLDRAETRSIWLAADLETQRRAIVECRPATADGGPPESVRRILELLWELDHPGLPKLLDAFAAEPWFCLVREYVSGRPLAQIRSFQPEEIRAIAEGGLAVLAYLQSRVPPLVLNCLRPQAIVVGEPWRVVLVGFDCPQATAGWTPDPTPDASTDPYHFALALAAVLLRCTPADLARQVAAGAPLDLADRLPQLSPDWLAWLERAIAADRARRFPDALAALAALAPLPVRRLPEARFDPPHLTLAIAPGAVAEAAVAAVNAVPAVALSGRWAIAPHPDDGPLPAAAAIGNGGAHPWIRLEPGRSGPNCLTCRAIVDGRALAPNRRYDRALLLYADGRSLPYALPLSVRVGPAGSGTGDAPPYGFLLLLFLFSWAAAAVVVAADATAGLMVFLGFGLGAGVAFARQVSGSAALAAATLAGLGAALAILAGSAPGLVARYLIGLAAGTGAWSGAKAAAGYRFVVRSGAPSNLAVTVLTAALGMGLGVGCGLGFWHAYVLAGSLLTGIPLVLLLARSSWSRCQQVDRDRP